MLCLKFDGKSDKKCNAKFQANITFLDIDFFLNIEQKKTGEYI